MDYFRRPTGSVNFHPGAKGKLAQRFLDGLAWYGDAVSEQSEAGKLVKFVAALERISITQGESSGGNKLSRRAAMLARARARKKSFRKYPGLLRLRRPNKQVTSRK